MDELDQRIADLEAKIAAREAELGIQPELVGPEYQSPAERFGDELISGKGALSDISNTATGLAGLGARTAQNAGEFALRNPMFSGLAPVVGGLEAFYEGDTPSQAIYKTGKLAASTAAALPTAGLGAGVGGALFDKALVESGELFGKDVSGAFPGGQLPTPESYGAEVRAGVTTGLPFLAAGGVARGFAGATGDIGGKIGRTAIAATEGKIPEMMYAGRNDPFAVPGSFGAVKGTAEKALQRAVMASDYGDEFLARNPMGAVDPRTGKVLPGVTEPIDVAGYQTRNEIGDLGFQKMTDNLSGLVEKGSRAKKEILARANEVQKAENARLLGASDIENPIFIGPKAKDFDLKALMGMRDELPAEAAQVVDDVIAEYLVKPFTKEVYQPPKFEGDTATYIKADNPVSLIGDGETKGLNELLSSADKEIRALKGYTPEYASQIYQKPISPLGLQAKIGALKLARDQLSKVLSKQAATILGDPKIEQVISTANDDIAVGLRYGELARAEMAQSAAGYRPMIEGSLNETIGRAGSIANKALDALQQPKTPVLNRGQTVDQLQALLRYQIGVDKPLSRVWLDYKTDPEMLGKVGGIAAQFGLLMDPSEIYKMPDAQKRNIIKEVAQYASDMFVPSASGFASEFDGKITNILDADAYAEQLYDETYDDPSARADRMGPFLSQKKVVFQSPPTDRGNDRLSILELAPQVDGGFGLPERMSMIEDKQEGEYRSLEEMLRAKLESYQSTLQ